MGGGKADVDHDHSKGPVGELCEPLIVGSTSAFGLFC